MTETRIFLLPDLGEGLPDAEIVQWHVEVGQPVALDAPLVSMETAKAVVEVPSPFSGSLLRRFGEAGEVIRTGAPLAEFALDAGPQRAAAPDTGHGHGHPAAPAAAAEPPRAPETRADAGSVVGAVAASDELRHEAPVGSGPLRVMPAVRALARKLGVDLRLLSGSGADGAITLNDVRRAAATGQGIAAPGAPEPTLPPPPPAAPAQAQALRGVRRNMARTMADAHARVVLTTLTELADLGDWSRGQDLSARLLRALVAGCRVEPALNAHYDDQAGTRTLLATVDVGIAVDSEDGLLVPVLRGAERLDLPALRRTLDQLREATLRRALPPEAFTGASISLSNFGMIAGLYATPVVVPPTVAILGAGRLHYQPLVVPGAIVPRRVLPLSLGFDHRVVTGGEAARFLRAVCEDLALAG